MTEQKNSKRIIKRTAIALPLIFAAFLILSSAAILYYLNEYGYGIEEYPKTLAVYLRLSKGFTVSDNNDNAVGGESLFIGRSDYIYDEVLEKNGWYQTDQMGNLLFYSTADNTDNENESRIVITLTGDWCHWFRVYAVSSGDIEDYLKGR